MTIADDLTLQFAKRNLRTDPVLLVNAALSIMRDPGEALARKHAHQPIFKRGELYLRRWYLAKEAGASVFLHELRTSDPEPHMHDHPWDFSSIIIEGGYDEETSSGLVVRAREGSLVERTGEHKHRIILQKSPTWTLCVAGRWRREWGFHTPSGWIDHVAYGRLRPEFRCEEKSRP